MELPSHLLKTYRAYKLQEQDLLQWISDNSRLQKALTQDSFVFKPSGRARTLARRAAQRKIPQVGTCAAAVDSMNTQSHERETPCLNLLEIVPYVQDIAENPQISSIPEGVWQNLYSVLELRQKCFSWFRQNTAQDDEKTREQNAKHAYPVSLLRETIETLAVKSPQRRRETTSDTLRQPVTVTMPRNAFNLLHVDEVSLSPEETHSGLLAAEEQEPQCQPSGNLRPKICEHVSSAEYVLALFCYLQDLHEIEDFVLLELIRYSLDQANASYLGFLINFATDLANSMYNSFAKSLDDDREHDSIFHQRGLRGSMPIDCETYPLERLRLCLTNTTFACFKNDGTASTQTTQKHDLRTGSSDDSFKSQSSLETAFVDRLYDLSSPTFAGGYGLYVEDNSVLCAKEAIACHQRNTSSKVIGYVIPLSWTFALRLEMLANDILNSDTGRPFQHLLESTRAYRKFFLRKKNFCLAPINHSGGIDKFWQSCGKSIDRVIERFRSVETEISPKAKEDLESKSLLCLFNISYIDINQVYCGIRAIQNSYVPRGLANLWNFLQEEDVLRVCWPDMDYLVQTLGERSMYSGKRPTSANVSKRVFRKYVLRTMGMNDKVLRNFDTHVDPDLGAILHTSLLLNMDDTCIALSTMLKDRSARTLEDGEANVEDAALIVTATEMPLMLGRRPANVNIEHGLIANRTDLWKLANKSPALRPVQLLAVVKRRLQRETATICDFDFVGFETACAVLVQDLEMSFKLEKSDF